MSRALMMVVLAIGMSSTGAGQAGVGRAVEHGKPPIIDMHLHAYSLDYPLFGMRPPNPATGRPSGAANGKEHLEQTLDAMRRYNIVKGVVSCGLENVEVLQQWSAGAPGSIIPSLGFDDPLDLDLGRARKGYLAGHWGVMGEVGAQYAGLAPGDPKLEPYFAMAEELDIPVGIHLGPGPPGASYTCCPKFRMSLGNPLLLEEVLIRHPRLRVYVMHAGWPMLEQLMALMFAYPKVYADLAAVNWVAPRKEFHAYLRRLVEAGFGKRLMFGSDQMVWPEAIGMAVENVNSADFLTEEQKRDIFYNNAARFLRL